MSNIVHSQSVRSDVLAYASGNCRRLRQAAGLSQEALAEASGISRRMIVNLEGGDTNISISSLDRLADALGVDFVAMVAEPGACAKRLEVVAWRGEDDASMGTLLGSVPASRTAELWTWTLAPGERYQAEPDPAGWHEMIVVTHGRLRIETSDAVTTVGPGDFAIYSSAQRYAYANAGGDTVRFIRTVAS